MKIHQFFEHHGIALNPFADEDAQTDPVFREHCIGEAKHPNWDKIFGSLMQPATAVVFGEKGSGKTALRLQMTAEIERFNRNHAGQRLYVVEYDDFNPFLDRFAERFHGRRRQPARMLREWKLWDHIDAILALGVTSLVDRMLDVREPSGPSTNAIDTTLAGRLDEHQKRDLLLLAACYDSSLAQPFKSRWQQLRKRIGFRVWKGRWDFVLGCLVMLAVFGGTFYWQHWSWFTKAWPYLIILAGWLPWLARVVRWHWRAWQIVRNVRIGIREVAPLRDVLKRLSVADLREQPMPSKPRTDDRFELLMKWQGILRTLGFSGVIVLVDRVDEPHAVNGSAEQMKALVWPLLDNKFLKHPGIGTKLLLPIELATFVEREDRDFYQRSRLDKQNMVPSLEWSGEALLDLANTRISACAVEGEEPRLRHLLDESISDDRLLEVFRSLRVPRHLFKFLHRLFVDHCNAHSDDAPRWRVANERFEANFAVYIRQQDAFDRGVGAG